LIKKRFSTVVITMKLLASRARRARLSGAGAWRSFASYAEKREQKASELADLVEVRFANSFAAQLREGSCRSSMNNKVGEELQPALLDVASREEVLRALQAGFATFWLHTEARVASVSDCVRAGK
jgi:hypothetical protein